MTNLKRIIDEKGVRQRWLAEQVGVTEVSMSRYVSGERIPKAPIAIRMADVLGVDVKELYGWDDKHVVGEPEQPETHDKRTETHTCDCISRQAEIDVTWFEPSYTDPLNVLTEVRDKIKVLPSAQSERQKGEWIDHTEDGYVECPFCHSATNCDGNKDELHFCFSCGADMREDGAECQNT